MKRVQGIMAMAYFFYKRQIFRASVIRESEPDLLGCSRKKRLQNFSLVYAARGSMFCSTFIRVDSQMVISMASVYNKDEVELFGSMPITGQQPRLSSLSVCQSCTHQCVDLAT